MKKLLVCMAVALMISFGASGQSIKVLDNNICQLEVAGATLKVDANRGGKGMSIQYNGQEVLAQHVPGEGFRNNDNDWGTTFWPSPQSEWNWPPIKTYDANPYTITQTANSVILTSGLDSKWPYRFVKEFTTDPQAGCFVINYTIENAGNADKAVAPWEITRVPAAGLLFFDAPEDKVSFNNENAPVPFQFSNGAVWFPFEQNARSRKSFANAEGWVAYVNNGLMFLKQFEDVEYGATAPGQEQVEIFVSGGVTFIEIENQGRYTMLKPGEKLTWTVRWYVRPVEYSSPSDELKAFATSILK
jgi:hypothetical protein